MKGTIKNSNGYARDLEEAILRITGGHRDKVDIFIGTVKDVDTDAMTCTVTCQSGEASVDLENVGLNAEANDGFVLTPSVDSTVIVIASKFINPYILFFSNLDMVNVVAANGYQFGKGTSPAVLGDKNAQALKDLAGKIDAIYTAISGAAVAAGDGGATFKTNILAALSANGFPIAPAFGPEADGTKSDNFTLD